MSKSKNSKKVICYLATSAGDYGGASRYLFVLLKGIDREKYQPIVLFPSEGPIFEQLDELGITYKIWGKHEFTRLSTYVFDILKTIYFLHSYKVDILHINGTGAWRSPEIIASKMLRIPVVVHFHTVGKRRSEIKRLSHTKRLPQNLRLSDLIIATSDFTAQNTIELNTPKKVVYNSVDLERYDQAQDIRKELGIGKDEIVISFIGQVREKKGIDVFIDLAKRIKDQKVKFIITGRCHGPQKFRDSYTEEKLYEEIDQSPQIKYLGYRSDIQNIYSLTDIVVMPTRFDESFGLVNIEAGAARKPIISTRAGAIPEIIKHGENGFLVDKNDSEALMRYTITLIHNQKLRENMGNKGREIVEKEFTERPIRELEKIYEGLIKR